jgi:predicted short-subunit dehydrogenase-like oxidoreductase (DUF2520 family)
MASALAQLLPQRGWDVLAVLGRGTIGEIPRSIERVLVAVSDEAIPTVAGQLLSAGLRGASVLHTSGAAGPDALSGLRAQENAVGVLHPLQTVPSAAAGVASLPGSAFAFAGDPAACAWAGELVNSLGGRPLAIESGAWHLYHAAAVIASNYQVTLTDAALELMERAGVSRAESLGALAPLVLSAASNTIDLGPEAALTGPVRRGDVQTVRQHLLALRSGSPLLLTLYSTAGVYCVELAKRAGLPHEKALQLLELFRTEGACAETAEKDS